MASLAQTDGADCRALTPHVLAAFSERAVFSERGENADRPSCFQSKRDLSDLSQFLNCANCHTGEYFTDGKIHDVGLGSDGDRYDGFNTPSLRGVYRKVRFLHDGRAKSLGEVLTEEHAPESVAGEGALSPSQLSDLVEYLKSL
jgi:hypothetical protein